MHPDVFISTTSVTLWGGLIVVLLLLAIGCRGLIFCCSRLSLKWFFDFYGLLLFFKCCLSLFLGLLLLGLFLQFSLCFPPLFFLLLGLGIGSKFIEVSLAGVDNDLLGTFLVGEEVGVPAEEAEDNVEEGVNVALLLDYAHQDAVETCLLTHCECCLVYI